MNATLMGEIWVFAMAVFVGFEVISMPTCHPSVRATGSLSLVWPILAMDSSER